MAPTISRRVVRPGKSRRNAAPVQVIETPADVPPAVLPQIEPVSEIVIETGKVRLRIIGAPNPQTVQTILQQLLR